MTDAAEKYRSLVEDTVKRLLSEDDSFNASVAVIGAAIGVIEMVKGEGVARQILNAASRGNTHD